MFYPYSYASYPAPMSMGYAPSSPYAYAGVSVPMYQALYYPHMATMAWPQGSAPTSPTPAAPLPSALPMTAFKPHRERRHTHFPHPSKEHKRDLLEETAFRYFGFTDEIGESWHDVIMHYVPKLKKKLGSLAAAGTISKATAKSLSKSIPDGKTIYNWSYYLTGGYAVVDALHKGYKAYEYHKDAPTDVRVKSALTQAVKTGLFQYLASFLAPLYIVKGFREMVKHRIERLPANHALLPKGSLGRLYLPAIACTVLLPIIAHPIDKAVHHGLNWIFKCMGLDKYTLG